MYSKIGAQINPLGLYVDIDGKVKFWKSEANFNGNVDDTVFITLDNTIQLYDLRNLRLNYLTILEAPRSNWTSPSNLDPSKINDTTIEVPSNTMNFFVSNTPVFFDSIQIISTAINQKKDCHNQEFFLDDIRGDGLTDSIIGVVQRKLEQFVHRYSDKSIPDKELEQLRNDISTYDTIVNKIAIYDYLVDKMVVYRYNENGCLSMVLGYHWSLGLEVDRAKYDKYGRINYYAREYVGMNTNEYFFKYDKFGRVKYMVEKYKSPSTDHSIEISYSIKVKLTYDNLGMLNSKSELQDGKWLTYFFEIK